MHSATYSPEDNKLRLYPACKLDDADYQRVKAAGFAWAPRQKIFVAGMWTPGREDLLIELCGEIGDEDTSLVERAEERAERFEDYSDKRERDAEQARAAVSAIADHIPMGQPILIGHHSEKRARKDAEKIENGMRRAVKAWETSKYWTDRAEGAIAHAQYKEVPAVRHRRIKGLEADLRKRIKTRDECQKQLEFWSRDDITMASALAFANYYDDASYEWKLAEYPRELPASQYEGSMSVWSALEGGVATVEQVKARRVPGLKRYLEGSCARWIAHIENRLAYERAMLGESGGIKADGFDLKPGGMVLNTYGEWTTILRVNKSNGAITSVSTNNKKYPRVLPVERIKDYREPTEELAEKAVAATKLPPICNYPHNGAVEVTQAEWDSKPKDYKGTRIVEATEYVGRHRVRYGLFGQRLANYCYPNVYITDAKLKEPPPAAGQAPAVKPSDLPKEKDLPSLERQAARSVAVREDIKAEESSPFAQMKESLRTGVKVVSAPQLFPTPASLARDLVKLADVRPGQRVLEPSAGTGNLVRAAIDRVTGADCVQIVAVEYNLSLAEGLREQRDKTLYANGQNFDVRCADFLECSDLGVFDRIVMNPPFASGADIKHIKHAATMLKPGGRLVALCANGPRQQEQLKPLADEWIDLPSGSFSEAGTGVNVAMLVIVAPIPIAEPSSPILRSPVVSRQGTLFEEMAQ